jgi:RES domain-containing protein
MALRVYRVCRSAYARLDGEGARRVGGRWNSPGHAVVYMAESVALAVLENLVHMPRRDFPEKYVAVTALIADSVRVLGVDEFQHAGEPESDTGDRWIDSGDSAVLRVKSVVVPGENLYLLNPAHPDFEQIRAEGIEPFAFDERLF